MNLFETTIRVLGGLQSAFAMAPGGDRLLLLKALDLGLRLGAAFKSPSGVPYSDVNLRVGSRLTDHLTCFSCAHVSV